MTEVQQYIAGQTTGGAECWAALEKSAVQYPWFTTARLLFERANGCPNDSDAAFAAYRASCGEALFDIDTERMTAETTDDVINRFLHCDEYRIVVDDNAPDETVTTEAALADEDDICTEELAEVYLAQGLKAEAVQIYRKLSLLNSEKSVYFAEIISKIETNN